MLVLKGGCLNTQADHGFLIHLQSLIPVQIHGLLIHVQKYMCKACVLKHGLHANLFLKRIGGLQLARMETISPTSCNSRYVRAICNYSTL